MRALSGGTLRRLISCFGLALLLTAHGTTSDAAEFRVLPSGQHTEDSRFEPLKDLDGYFPFQPSSSVDAWNTRAEQRRTAMRVALGLWPMPTAIAPEAVVHSRKEMEGYTIEKVYFQSMPGFYVTGNLYRPTKPAANGKYPAVLCPHGHYDNGRFGASSPQEIRREIVTGGERFEDGGRNPIQSLCVQLARMGCIAFNYDMIGYCDSTQISFDLAHRFAVQRAEMIDPARWGFFSPQAESNLQSIAGLQTYHSIRSLDWILSLPEVDASRIAVTGSSGGGTQTFLLCALDPRPAIAIPAVMVSTAMQGGCTCENASLLRVGTGNVEFAALIAPRPLCLISADDWTREMSTKGFPELKAHYELMGAGDRLFHHPLLHFGHNYNYVSRAVAFQFLNQQFQLGLEEPVVEENYQRLTGAELSVWDAQHPHPESGPEFERRLLRWWADDARHQLDALIPDTAEKLAEYRRVLGSAWDALIGRRANKNHSITLQETLKEDRGNYILVQGLLESTIPSEDPAQSQQTEILPVVGLIPHGWNQGRAAIWIDRQGKAGLLQGDQLRPEVQTLLSEGVAVVGVDLMEQGEMRSGAGSLAETRRVENPREAAAYTLGYNRSLFAQRVHDVLTVIQFATSNERAPNELWLVALDGAGPWAAAACAQSDGLVKRAVIDTKGFRFQNVPGVRHEDLLPGGAKYHDLPGLLALAAPSEIRVSGETADTLAIPRAVYESAGAGGKLSIATSSQGNADAIRWLLGR